MNTEERDALQVTLTALIGGALMKFLFLTNSDAKWLEVIAVVLLGLGAGSTASLTTSWIMRNTRERKMRGHFGKYAGEWTRTVLISYWHSEAQRARDKSADGLKITIAHKGSRFLQLDVEYDKGRGTVNSHVEFNSDQGTIGQGTYVYISGPNFIANDNEGIPHSGIYTVHLFDDNPNLIRVYHDGKMPDDRARGYEVWVRNP